jgi:uncharacterized protein (DUF2267 family)
MTEEGLLRAVEERAGFARREETERALGAVLDVLAERLGPADAEALARELPSRLGGPLAGGGFEADFDLEELTGRIAAREGVSRSFALEHAQAVCQAIAEAVSLHALERLHRTLPEPIADLFTPPVRTAEPPPRHASATHTTLSEGRPGSRHPLSEARPGSSHPVSEARADRAQSESVARADNPHGDTKLSSSPGLTQEREHESLATGRPPRT